MKKIVLIMSLLVFSAMSAVAGQTYTISVTETAIAAYTPDAATMSFRLEASAPSKRAAFQIVDREANQFIEQIKKIGIGKDEIQLHDISSYPMYSGSDKAGVNASRRIVVTVYDLAAYEQIISIALVTESLQIENMQMFILDESPYAAQAISDAIQTSRHTAEAAAKAANSTLSSAPIAEITVEPYYTNSFSRKAYAGQMGALENGDSSINTTITPMTLSRTVHVTYRAVNN